MTFRTLIRRSLRFHWRSHLGVVLGAAIGSAALIGAIVVGDSVKESLRERALQQLPGVWTAMSTGDRFFQSDLTARMYGASTNAYLHATTFSPNTNLVLGIPNIGPGSLGHELIQLPASAVHTANQKRVNQISLFGVDADFGRQAMGINAEQMFAKGDLILNATLADELSAAPGDDVLVRLPKVKLFSAENAVSRRDDEAIALRLKVAAVLPLNVGNFSLRSASTPPRNAFVFFGDLASALDLKGQANLLVTGPANRWHQSTLVERFKSANFQSRHMGRPGPFKNFDWVRSNKGQTGHPANAIETAELATELLAQTWSLSDAQADFKRIDPRILQLATPRIFLDEPIAHAVMQASTSGQPILTYLATLLCAGTNAAPYSMVTAARAPWTPAGLRDDEIVVNQWLADDLHVKPGNEIALSYFLPESGAKLKEGTNIFRVHSIVPMEMPWADRTLMPDFPGIEKAESTSDWDAGFPLTYKVRPKDDEYWRQHRGTPKAFITLAAGQKMWGNRFGNLTAIRFPIPVNSSATNYQAELEKKILANLKPEELGLRFEPVREQALKAAEQSQDFGGLFLGFSFFLIIAALLLMAMLFQFGLEQRAPEIGTLLALGFTPGRVRKLLLCEGVTLAFFGGVLGAIGGIYFARGMLHGLTTIWRDAVGAATLNFHVTAQTLVIGLLASVVVSTVVIGLGLRKFVKRPARELLVGEIGGGESKVRRPKSKVVAVAALAAGLALVGWAVVKGDTQNAGTFFGAGALVLIAGLSFTSAWLLKMERKEPNHAGLERHAPFTTMLLALRGCARRRKRSLATVAMLASGSFLIVSIGVFRLDANRDATQKTSGTGGFALIGETTLPVVQDLNSAAGRDFFALNESDLAGVNFVPFRVRAGDEASCLNLNAAQKPRLLGVKPEMLAGRFGFSKVVAGLKATNEWLGLQRENLPNGPSTLDSPSIIDDFVPAIGDANSIQWAMHKKVGDTIDYVDERGQAFKVRIVGAVANSILQGQLIIDEAEFVKRFPGESGYRMFLIDAPSNAVSQVSATLSRAMQDVGLELTTTAVRLNQFNAVQNTYLGTFQVLGGLGLLLGSVGLGIVVLRNVLERRSELAVLLAVGFRKQQVQRLLLLENGALLVVGLTIGVVAAGIAVLPALLSPAAQLPVTSLAVTLAAVLLNGALWTWVATRYAVRGDLLAALRNE